MNKGTINLALLYLSASNFLISLRSLVRIVEKMNRKITFPTRLHVRPAKTQNSLRIQHGQTANFIQILHVSSGRLVWLDL